MKTTFHKVLILFFAINLFPGTNALAQVPEWADTVLFNGKIIQADTENPLDSNIAEAVAIKRGKIMAVGDEASIMALAHANTNRIDLGGKTVVPGLIDTHSHIQEYALGHFGPILVPELREVRVQGDNWAEVKANSLEAIKLMVDRTESGKWIVIGLPYRFDDPNGNKVTNTAAIFAPWGVIPGVDEPVVTRTEMDQVAPNNPILVSGAATAIFNSYALNLIEDFYGQAEHPRLDMETGASGVLLARSVRGDIITGGVDTFAEIIRREAEEWVGFGMTTISTSFSEITTLRAFYQLEEQGKLPNRMAFSHGWALTANPQAPNFYRYYGIPDGFGSPRLWTTGVSVINLDHVPPNVEMTLQVGDVSDYTKKQEFSWLNDTSQGNITDVLMTQLRAGHSLKGNHIGGDYTMDRYMDIIDSIAKERGWSPEHVRSLAIGYDHSRIYPRPDQIPRMAQMNIQASIGPKYLESNSSGEGLVELYGREIVDEWQVPTRSLVEGGVLTAWEIDTHAIAQRPGNAFYYIQLLVTRNIDGEVYGAQNRVDRLTALYTATRWAAEYVRRADTLGSIEPGKWADLVVLERDYLEVPDEEIHTVNPVMVMVAGEVEYQE